MKFQIKKHLSVALILLALCGVQVIQASPLHDHTSHLTGCALCHFDGAHAIQAATPVHDNVPEAAELLSTALFHPPYTRVYPAAHGRAPPALSL